MARLLQSVGLSRSGGHKVVGWAMGKSGYETLQPQVVDGGARFAAWAGPWVQQLKDKWTAYRQGQPGI